MGKFRVGDRVKHYIYGYGTILVDDGSTRLPFGVRLDQERVNGHTLTGRCESGYGLWSDECDLTWLPPLSEEKAATPLESLQETMNDIKKMLESDPNGTDQHAPGAKLDAGKLRPHLVLSSFKNSLHEVCKNGTFGANKYSDNGWKEVPNAHNRYMDAALRHWFKYEMHTDSNDIDPDSQVHHLAAMAWNILAVLELILESKS